jgi:hypothetical protein
MLFYLCFLRLWLLVRSLAGFVCVYLCVYVYTSIFASFSFLPLQRLITPSFAPCLLSLNQVFFGFIVTFNNTYTHTHTHTNPHILPLAPLINFCSLDDDIMSLVLQEGKVGQKQLGPSSLVPLLSASLMPQQPLGQRW